MKTKEEILAKIIYPEATKDGLAKNLEGFGIPTKYALQAIQEYADEQCIEFAEWVADSRWEIDVKGKWWDLNDELEGITSDELLKLWKGKQK